MNLDLEFVRAQFPAFREPTLTGFAQFENAGGSYAAAQTIDWLDRYYRQTKVQPYYAFAASALAGEQMDAARSRMAEWVRVGNDEIHFGPSTSQNTFVLAQALRRFLKSGDEIIVTNQDHEANVGAYSRLADDGIVVREWTVNPQTAELERKGLEDLLGPRTKLVAFTHCSNVVGRNDTVAAPRRSRRIRSTSSGCTETTTSASVIASASMVAPASTYSSSDRRACIPAPGSTAMS